MAQKTIGQSKKLATKITKLVEKKKTIKPKVQVSKNSGVTKKIVKSAPAAIHLKNLAKLTSNARNKAETELAHKAQKAAGKMKVVKPQIVVSKDNKKTKKAQR